MEQIDIKVCLAAYSHSDFFIENGAEHMEAAASPRHYATAAPGADSNQTLHPQVSSRFKGCFPSAQTKVQHNSNSAAAAAAVAASHLPSVPGLPYWSFRKRWIKKKRHWHIILKLTTTTTRGPGAECGFRINYFLVDVIKDRGEWRSF